MKKILAVTLVAAVALSFVCMPDAECRTKKNLYKKFSGKEEVKVYVMNVTDSSGKAKADLRALKETLENALTTRMTINFKVVPDEKEADIIIAADITEFTYMDTDPIDNISGSAAIVYDAMTQEHYVRMQAVFTVTDAKKNKKIWHEKIKATVTDKTMSQDDSIIMANERMVKVFMRDCFGKIIKCAP